MENNYPTKKDIERHIDQLVTSLRQYFRDVGRTEFVKNGFQVLFTDLSLEASNEGFDVLKVQLNFNNFLRKMLDDKTPPIKGDRK